MLKSSFSSPTPTASQTSFNREVCCFLNIVCLTTITFDDDVTGRGFNWPHVLARKGEFRLAPSLTSSCSLRQSGSSAMFISTTLTDTILPRGTSIVQEQFFVPVDRVIWPFSVVNVCPHLVSMG